MSFLPDDLERLPPQALEVIRFLAGQPDGASTEAIISGAGISERACGKALRRLVTRYYVSMPAQGFYRLTPTGHEAAALLGPPISSAEPERAPEDPPEPVRQVRRLSAFLPRELVQHMPTQVRVGLDPAPPDAPALSEPLRLVLRLSAPECEVVPVEAPLEVGAGAAGPIVFRITPGRAGSLRLTITVLQPLTPTGLIPTGRMFFEMGVATVPSPASAAFVTFGAPVRLVLPH